MTGIGAVPCASDPGRVRRFLIWIDDSERRGQLGRLVAEPPRADFRLRRVAVEASERAGCAAPGFRAATRAAGLPGTLPRQHERRTDVSQRHELRTHRVSVAQIRAVGDVSALDQRLQLVDIDLDVTPCRDRINRPRWGLRGGCLPSDRASSRSEDASSAAHGNPTVRPALVVRLSQFQNEGSHQRSR